MTLRNECQIGSDYYGSAADLRMRQAPHAEEGKIEYGGGVGKAGEDIPLYCCLVDFGWEGVLRDMEG